MPSSIRSERASDNERGKRSLTPTPHVDSEKIKPEASRGGDISPVDRTSELGSSEDLRAGQDETMPRYVEKRGEIGKDTQGFSQDAVVAEAGYDSSTGTYWRYLEWDTAIPDILPYSLLPPGEMSDHPPPQLPEAYHKIKDPFTWGKTQRAIIIIICAWGTIVAAWTSGGYSMGIEGMQASWGASKLALLSGIFTFTGGFGISPMFLAPISEIYGRKPVLMSTYALMCVTTLGCALVDNLPGMLVLRFFQGSGASSFSSILGGIISDTHHTEDRRFPMSIFASAGMVGTGLGPIFSGIAVQYLSSWRWIHWIQLILNGVGFVALAIALKETRAGPLLQTRADIINSWLDEMEKQEGRAHPNAVRIRWKVKAMEESENLMRMIRVSLTRPFHILFTEPIVFFFSAWAAFCWCILYLFLSAVNYVFIGMQGFNHAQSGLVFISMVIGGILANFLDTGIGNLALHYFPTKAPEQRVYSSCILGFFLPVGILWYGWTATDHWILPTIAVGWSTVGIYSIYLASFNYLVDSYHRTASSALAAQSFCRNMFGGSLPMLGGLMFDRLGVRGGTGLLAGLGGVLGVIPWVLVFYGPAIRARSKLAAELARQHH